MSDIFITGGYIYRLTTHTCDCIHILYDTSLEARLCTTCPCAIYRELEGRVCDLHADS